MLLMVAVRIQDAEQDQSETRHYTSENGKRRDSPRIWSVLQVIHTRGIPCEMDRADCGGEKNGGEDAADAEYWLEGEGADV